MNGGGPAATADRNALRGGVHSLWASMARQSELSRRRRWLSVGLCFLVGSAILVLAYASAAASGPSPLTYLLFWAALLIVVVPVTASLLVSPLLATERVSMLVLLGAYGVLPKLLRTPDGPLYHDELAHWEQTRYVLSHGTLYARNTLVPAITSFPGLHTVTAALAEITGLSPWRAGQVLVVVAHVLQLLGVAALTTAATRSARIGGVAAALYAANPSWVFFDTQFSYETLALPLATWTLTLAVIATRARGRSQLFAAAGILPMALATAMTHHLTSIMLAIALTGLAASAAVRRWRATRWDDRESVAGACAAAAAGVAVIAAWLTPHAGELISYLGPSLQSGIAQLRTILTEGFGRHGTSGDGGAGTQRLFAGSTLPVYEIVAALLTPFVLLAAAVWTVIELRRRDRSGRNAVRRRLPSAVSVFAVVGAGYFVSLPLLFTSGASEAVHRSWAFSFVGLAVVTALLVVGLERRWHGWPRWRRRAVQAALLASLVVVTVGNVAAGPDPDYRFPGPYRVGSDTRGNDAELRAAAAWLLAHAGPRHNVVTDRYTGEVFAAYGDQFSSVDNTPIGTWSVYESLQLPTPVVEMLRAQDYRFLVVDIRMKTTAPQLGYWIDPNEPRRQEFPKGREGPVPAAAIDRYECLPWTQPVYASTHLRIYRLDFAAYSATQTQDVTDRLADDPATLRECS